MTFPVIASMLRSRAMCAGLVGLLGLQVALSAAGVRFMDCHLLKTTGVPCPGCGLTRGAVATARLDLHAVWHFNVFGPLALLVVGLMFLGAVLPNRQRLALASVVGTIERKTGITNSCFILLWVYWLARLALIGQALGHRLSVVPGSSPL